MGSRRDESEDGPVVLVELLSYPLVGVSPEIIAGPDRVTGGLLSGEHHLGVKLIAIHRPPDMLPHDQLSVLYMARPPEYQLSVVSYLMSHIPVDLRHHIVHQPLPVPEEDIGVEIVIVLQTTGLGSDRMGSLISVDAEGTDAELDVGLDATDGL